MLARARDPAPARRNFYSLDHLGSVREVVDDNIDTIARYSYAPFGESEQTIGTFNSNFKFAGYYSHARSDLYFTFFRAYNSKLGKWLSRDPIGEQVALNLLSYVENEPIRSTDPLGLQGTAGGSGQKCCINWNKVTDAAVTGAMGGAAGGAQVGGAGGAVAGGGVLSVAGSAAGAVGGAIVGAAAGALIFAGSEVAGQTISNMQGWGNEGKKSEAKVNAEQGSTTSGNWAKEQYCKAACAGAWVGGRSAFEACYNDCMCGHEVVKH